MAKAELKWDLLDGSEDEKDFASEASARDYSRRVLQKRDDVDVVYLCGADGVAREMLFDRSNKRSFRRK